MSESRLEQALREGEVPEPVAARERAWAVAASAYQARPARRRLPLAALLVAVGAVALAIALTPPGDAVADWVQRIVSPAEPATPVVRPAPAGLPAGGKVLAVGEPGAYVVTRDGRRRIGDYSGATWSPRGIFAAVWRGGTLAAVDSRGALRWRIGAPARVRVARWSPEGFHVAYVSAGRLRVVSGQGRGDTAVRRGAGSRRSPAPALGAAAPAFRPGALRTLAYATRGGRIEVVELFSGTLLWRSPRALGDVRRLAWSADGRRLLAVTPLRLWVADVLRSSLRSWPLPAGRRALALAAAPRGRRVALLLAAPGGATEVAIARHPDARPRTALSVPSRLRDLEFSPDGRWLASTWPAADQWLFVPARVAGVASTAGLTRSFGAVPRIAGWCCAAQASAASAVSTSG